MKKQNGASTAMLDPDEMRPLEQSDSNSDNAPTVPAQAPQDDVTPDFMREPTVVGEWTFADIFGEPDKSEGKARRLTGKRSPVPRTGRDGEAENILERKKEALEWARNLPVKDAAKCMAHALAGYVEHREMRCSPSIGTLANACGIDRSYACKVLVKLEAMGHIRRRQRPKRDGSGLHESTVYILVRADG